MQVPLVLKEKWFWYSVLSVLCMGGWTLLGNWAHRNLRSYNAISLSFRMGTGGPGVPLGQAIQAGKKPRGNLYSVSIGVLGGIGGLAFFAACRTGGNTSAITAATAMYPLITVVLAVMILREKLTWVHVVGLLFAAVAIVLFSL
jgi:drug/metabolite transporter (DMT)-like permease